MTYYEILRMENNTLRDLDWPHRDTSDPYEWDDDDILLEDDIDDFD